MLSERAAPPGCSNLSEVRGVKSLVFVEMYSYIFSISVGAQWTHWTGCPISDRVFHAEKMDDEEGGHESGGKDSICPLGRLESAIDMPAI